MPTCRLLVPGLLAAAAAGFTGDAPAPILDASFADGAKLVSHWDASIYGKLWNDPVLARVREQWKAKLDEMEAGLGFKPLEALAAMKGGGLRLSGFAKDKQQVPLPKLQLECDLGEFTAKLLQIVRAANQEPGALADLTVAGASEALAVEAKNLQLARFANLLLIGFNGAPTDLRPWKPAPAQADVQLTMDGTRYTDALGQLLTPESWAELGASLKPVSRFISTIDYRLDLVPEGMQEKLVSHAPPFATLPADRDLLGRLPAKTLLALAMGIDGPALWKELRAPLLAQAAKASGAASPEAAENQLNQQLSGLGMTCTVAQLVEGLRGSLLLAVTPGAPFPAVTVALPRSAALDQVLGVMMKQLQVVAPTEGQAAMLPLPGLPVPLQLAFDKTHWLLTSDPQLAESWLGGKPGGWADSAAGRAALAKAPKNASLIGASDTPAVLGALTNFVAMGLAQNNAMEPKDKQAVMQGLAKAAALASTGWLVAYPDGQQAVVEDRGLIGFGPFIVAMVAGVSTRTATSGSVGNEAAAAGALKSQVFPAEVQFKGGMYLDQDADGSGEFGFLSELGGVRPTPNAKAGVLQLIDPRLTGGTSGGYDFAVFLPDGKGGALSDPAQDGPRPANAGAAKEQAKHFVAYAWPSLAGSGGRMFAITEAGTVFSAPASGQPPAWNELFGGGGWDAAPSWPRYQPKARARAGGNGAPPAGGAAPAGKPGATDF
jgi:hypothetical protein